MYVCVCMCTCVRVRVYAVGLSQAECLSFHYSSYIRPGRGEGSPNTAHSFSHPLLEPSGESSSMGTSFFFLFLWAKLTVFKVL